MPTAGVQHSMTIEIPLTGGNTTSGVVRVGNTVRRPLKPASDSVHRLLQHLERKGFDKAPRFLGIDEKNREIQSFIDGDTNHFDFIWSDSRALTAIARLLKEYHLAVADFDFRQLQWLYSYPDSARHEVICHNDFAPYNMIFQGNSPCGIIDFDLAGPGPVLRDVAYAAYWSVPLSFHSTDMSEFGFADIAAGCQRLHSFCAEYGVVADRALLQQVAGVLHHMGDKSTVVKMLGLPVAEQLEREGHLRHWQQEHRAFSAVMDKIAANLNNS